MAQQNGSPPPDLATVLRNLAALSAPQPQAAGQTPPNAQYNAPTAAPATSQRQHVADPRLASRSQRPGQQQQHVPVSTTPPGTPPIPQASLASAPAPIDPATIIEWAPGLRCITKVAARNPSLKPIVQKMIADQHEHELIWWGGRQALLKQRANTEQLRAYDRKVHKAQSDMFGAMAGQLKSLCVPFFGVRPELVEKEGDEYDPSTVGGPTKVTETELVKLQRRMVEYLEDMYKD